LQLAARNHAIPLEALRYDVTPVGLHYLLIHYDIPAVDLSAWRLTVDGRVRRPLSLSFDDVLARPQVTAPVTMECAGNGRALLEPRPLSQPWLMEAVGTGEWTGTPVRPLLEEAGVEDGAVDVVFAGLDRGVEGGVEQTYERAIPLEEAVRDEVFMAYELSGQPLPPQHGYPLRLVVPGWYGMTQVKWLTRITVLDRTFDGYQNAQGYRYKESDDDPGRPVTRMMPRALMVPPGMPEFMSRARIVESSRQLIIGRAWSGWGPIERVEFSDNGGRDWREATVAPQAFAYAWQQWSVEWDAEPGEFELCCKATDAAGNAQPDGQAWNLKGYSNNEVQRVPVTVRP
jgi:DMSO/TMAO reductase YedYZ molybdopterin-dependent catalytic subunit